MKRIIAVTVLSTIAFTSCVSKKKYVDLEQRYQASQERLGAIENKVSDYYAKINSLSGENDSLSHNMLSLNDLAAMSEANKEAMRATLEKVDDSLMAQATTLEDSINLAVAYNLERHINSNGGNDDIQVSVDGTVVVVNLSDELLFNSGSSWVSRDAYPVLEKLAAVINTEPAMQVMVVGHTDTKKVVEGSYLIDNWDLSVRRSAAVVRLLQNKFEVAPEKLIATGRSSYDPAVEGNSSEALAKNRRTTIAILPNLDKFLALLDSTNEIEVYSERDSEVNNQTKTEEKPQNTIDLETKNPID